MVASRALGDARERAGRVVEVEDFTSWRGGQVVRYVREVASVGNMDMSRNVRGEAVPKQCVVDLAPGLEAAPGWCLRAAFNHVTRGGPGLEI
jgi:hypothetical protein